MLGYLKVVSKSFADSQSRRSLGLCEGRPFPRLRYDAAVASSQYKDKARRPPERSVKQGRNLHPRVFTSWLCESDGPDLVMGDERARV